MNSGEMNADAEQELDFTCLDLVAITMFEKLGCFYLSGIQSRLLYLFIAGFLAAAQGPC